MRGYPTLDQIMAKQSPSHGFSAETVTVAKHLLK